MAVNRSGPDVFLDQSCRVVAFQRLELVEKAPIGSEIARRRFGQAAAFCQGQQGFR